jgi:hypothetical protein
VSLSAGKYKFGIYRLLYCQYGCGIAAGMGTCFLVFCYYTQTSDDLAVNLKCDQLDKECSFAVLLQNTCQENDGTEQCCVK